MESRIEIKVEIVNSLQAQVESKAWDKKVKWSSLKLDMDKG